METILEQFSSNVQKVQNSSNEYIFTFVGKDGHWERKKLYIVGFDKTFCFVYNELVFTCPLSQDCFYACLDYVRKSVLS